MLTRTHFRPPPPRRTVRRSGGIALPLFGLLAAFLLLGSSSVEARSLTEAETASLAATVDAFDSAMRSNDLAAVVETIPPRVLEHIAAGAGVGVDELRGLLIKQMGEVLAQATIDSFEMDLAKADHRELEDGIPYALVPTETVMTIDGSKTAMRSHTLALLDEGIWYLVRVSDAKQLEILRQVYPEYVGVEFPRGSMEALSQ
jgi:hypothetical protein